MLPWTAGNLDVFLSRIFELVQRVAEILQELGRLFWLPLKRHSRKE